jgi:hypothetical protein
LDQFYWCETIKPVHSGLALLLSPLFIKPCIHAVFGGRSFGRARTISALLDYWEQADKVEKDKKLRLQGNFYKDQNEHPVTEQ